MLHQPVGATGGGAGISVLTSQFQASGALNLIRNSPGQIVTDGAEPQWWDDVANAAITDEDALGEGIPDISARVFKVVTTADDVYGFQNFVCTGEEFLDAGVTVVSLSAWVYCATGAKASIAIAGTNLGIQESTQAPAGAWTLLTVEGITLSASDLNFDVRLIVDTDTAYFAMPMFTLGPRALPWSPRGQKFVPIAGTLQIDLATTGDVAWSDTDCTTNTHALATMIQVVNRVREPDGTLGSAVYVGHSDNIFGSDFAVVRATENVIARNFYDNGCVMCDDAQNIRYTVLEQDADNDVLAQIYITGYWRWE